MTKSYLIWQRLFSCYNTQNLFEILTLIKTALLCFFPEIYSLTVEWLFISKVNAIDFTKMSCNWLGIIFHNNRLVSLDIWNIYWANIILWLKSG